MALEFRLNEWRRNRNWNNYKIEGYTENRKTEEELETWKLNGREKKRARGTGKGKKRDALNLF